MDFLGVKIDYSPAWTLNEKVIDFIFFSDKESREKSREKSKTFERISKYNNVRAEAYVWLLFFAIMFIQVLSEERRLHHDFGKEYDAYRCHTRRF